MDDLEEALPDEDGVRIKFYVLSKAKLILLYDNIVYSQCKNRIIYLQEDDLNLDTFGKKKKKKKKDRLGDADGDDADDGENKENGKFIYSFVRYSWIY